MGDEALMDILRPVKSSIDKDVLIIHTELGYDVYYKLSSSVVLNPVLEENGMPFFSSDIKFEYIKTVKTPKALSKQKCLQYVNSRGIIPYELAWKRFFIGFVYSNKNDPNNHKWWVDLRNNENVSLYSIFGDKIKINCPFSTFSWFSDGFNHGRFVIDRNNLKDLYYKNGELRVVGNKVLLDTKQDNVCSIQNINENVNKLRLRYDIKSNIWFCDFLTTKEEVTDTVGVSNILCDAPAVGHVLHSGDKPKVSMYINTSDISSLSIAINALIIRGK